MCLSTVYRNEMVDNNIVARYVSEIKIKGDQIELVDVMGTGTNIRGWISFVDLTGGKVVISSDKE